ncbi:MAG: succinate dehydrogenase cytochrome b subunit [Propionibacteriaceae bacterium]|nr:succinate dehydrogenase cytochrome b subunit [Propionibacteriaceae bacterium]
MAVSVEDKPPIAREPAELPPALTLSPLTSKALPNWALKACMAITGTVGALFLAVHLLGNLKVYLGADAFNKYASGLRSFGEPYLPAESFLWLLRIVLLICLVVHVIAGIMLWERSRVARGKFKAKRTNGLRAWSATIQPISGILIFVFLIFHLADLTWGKVVAAQGFVETTATTSSAYQNLVHDFSRPWSAIIYVIMMILIAAHVGHGVSTVVHDLGSMGWRWRAVFVVIAGALAIVILLGNASIPIAVLAKVVTLS